MAYTQHASIETQMGCVNLKGTKGCFETLKLILCFMSNTKTKKRVRAQRVLIFFVGA